MSNSHECNAEDPISQGLAADFREQASSDFTFTWFRDQFARRKRLIRLSSTEKFARCLRATRAPSKAALPWAKLAELGPTRSPNDSYRYDANVVALLGAEGDYDGDEVPIEDAAALIQAAGIEAILNETTTPGHWRIWLPASRAYRGSTDELRSLRARWVARGQRCPRRDLGARELRAEPSLLCWRHRGPATDQSHHDRGRADRLPR